MSRPSIDKDALPEHLMICSQQGRQHDALLALKPSYETILLW